MRQAQIELDFKKLTDLNTLSYKYDIFLSHSHVDDAFAKRLAGMLDDDAHLSVWLDDYGMRVGDEILPVVQKALEESQHAVFVVTESWLKGRWTKWEVEHFDHLRAASTERRMVPLLRDVEELPPYFTGIHYLRWSAADDEQPDTLFRKLLYGLTGQNDGQDESKRAEKGLRVRGLGPKRGPVLNERTAEESNFRASKQIQWGGDHYALSCDRSTQWGDLSTEVANPNHEAIFVVGPQGRAHDKFLQRIEECLGYPDGQIKKVKWSKRTRAVTERAFKTRLAKAVGCKDLDEKLDENLEAKLADALQDHNLVLLHRPVCTHEIKSEIFVSYYTEILPELIAKVRERTSGNHGVKIIQAVAWDEPSPMKRRLAGLFHRLGIGGAWVQRAREHEEARSTLQKICGKAEARGLTVLSLRELEEITKDHVVELSKRLPSKLLKPEMRDDFVADVMSSAKDSDQIFNKITEWLKEDDDEGDSPL